MALERFVASKRWRLENLRKHRRDCKYPVIEDLAEEITEYFDVIGVTKVVNKIYRYFYDSYNKNDDPVGLVKARKKDSRELHKAKRKHYRTLWREWEIKDEITKLKTLLGVLAPQIYTPDGNPKPKDSVPTIEIEVDDIPSWANISPHLIEHIQFAHAELKLLEQHHLDQSALLSEQQTHIEKLLNQQQQDTQVLLEDFDQQIKNQKNTILFPHLAKSSNFDVQILQTQLGQMQTIQRRQIQSLQRTHYQEMMTQHNLHKHEHIQRLQSLEGSKQQSSLQNMLTWQNLHEKLRHEHEEQILDFLDDIQDQQQQTFDDSVAILGQKKTNVVMEGAEQTLKRTEQQLQQLHAKQIEQLQTLQERELHGISRLHKIMKKQIEAQIKQEHQSLSKEDIHSHLLHHQDMQLKNLIRLHEENKELIEIIYKMINNTLSSKEGSDLKVKSEEVLSLIGQVGQLEEKTGRIFQQMIYQELPYSIIPKIPEEQQTVRKMQQIILEQERRIQQQCSQQLQIRSLLETLHELIKSQKVVDCPYKSSLVQIMEDCKKILKRIHKLCNKQKLRNELLHELEEDLNHLHSSFWKKKQKKNEPVSDLGKSLLKGKLKRGNLQEVHPLLRLSMEIQTLQKNYVEHHEKLLKAINKISNKVDEHVPIEQEIQLRRQQEKTIFLMTKDTAEIEEEQDEDLSPLDLQQHHIDALTNINLYIKNVVQLKTILVDKCYDKGCTRDLLQKLSALIPIFINFHSIQEDHVKMVSAQEDELVSNYERIGKTLLPKQIVLTEGQLKKQKAQLKILKNDLMIYFKNFTSHGKADSFTKIPNPSEMDRELLKMFTLLENQILAIDKLLEDRQKEYVDKTQDLAKKVLLHHRKVKQLSDSHRNLLAQYEDMSLEPSKDIMNILIELHSRLIPILKNQYRSLKKLFYFLKRNQTEIETRESDDEFKEKSDDSKIKSLKVPRKESKSLLDTDDVSITGVVVEKTVETDITSMKSKGIIEPLKEAEERIRMEVAEKKKSVFFLNEEITEEEKERQEKYDLILSLKEKNSRVLGQVQIHNKPELFFRVQTPLQQKGKNPKMLEKLQTSIAEFKDARNQISICQKPVEIASIEENQKQFIKLFDLSEKQMLEKSTSISKIQLLNLLKENMNQQRDNFNRPRKTASEKSILKVKGNKKFNKN